MIPPRGCAYICMVHRQDAYRALQKLSTGSYKIGSKVIKVGGQFFSCYLLLCSVVVFFASECVCLTNTLCADRLGTK